MLEALRRLSISPEIRGPSAVFLSQVVLNFSFFFVTFMATIILAPAEFAQLSLALGWVSVVANLLSFGLDQSALKLGIERSTSSFIALNFCFKGFILVLTIGLALIAHAATFLTAQSIILVAASGVAFWTSTRLVEQYQRHFNRLAALNLALALSRVVAGGLSLMTHSWILIVVTLHLVSQLPIHLFALTNMFRELRLAATYRDLAPMFRTAPVMFLSSALFGVIPVMMQQAIFVRGQVEATAAFGVVLLFSAPVALMTGTLRMYLLPQVLAASCHNEVFQSYGRNITLPFVAMMALGLPLLIGLVIHLVYGERLPQASLFAMCFLGLMGLETSIGILNMRSQRGNFIFAELAANALRFAVAGAICYFVVDPFHMIVWCTAAYPIVELGLYAFLAIYGPRARLSEARHD